MRARNHKRYARLGLCEQWEKSFEQFLADMGPRPSAAHTIDRIDNEKGYDPTNCRWALPKTQANNRSITKMLCYRGETKPLTEWAALLGIKSITLRSRLRKGASVAEAFETPVAKRTYRLTIATAI